MRHFLVERNEAGLKRIDVFDSDKDALDAFHKRELELGIWASYNGRDVVLLGADDLSTCIATHGNWFNAPNPVMDELLASSPTEGGEDA